MSNVRTVSDTKRAFYNSFNRPIVSVYRRIIEELMVEMHLLSVSSDFVYDALYALGIVTTYDTFMAGYRPEEDVPEIFKGLCESIEAAPEGYRQDSESVVNSLNGKTIADLQTMLSHLDTAPTDGLAGVFKAVVQRDRFKYSRAFGIGLYTVVEKLDPELVKDKDKLMGLMKEAASALGISFDKLQKDIELYRSNLDKMAQAKILMAEMLETERKKREERARAQTEKAATPVDGVTTSDETGVPTPNRETEDTQP